MIASQLKQSSKFITPPPNCTGCGLCANVCSKNAIRMVWSEDGFLVPQVDVSSCVNCGLCAQLCIAKEVHPPYSDDIESVVAYGGWHRDEDIHLQSSSGGIFSALAMHVIQQGGVVFGVVWKDKITAVFDKAETPEELTRMRGSKYTPAIPGSVYRDCRSVLKKGRQVLFCGTPCQIHALKKYLGKEYSNLLTIDIVCHGMPSHLLMEQYIREMEQGAGKSIKYVSFREKPEGWINFHIACYYEDSSRSTNSLREDLYMKIFLSDKALNQACYNCPYAHIPRQGDITLGDYWNVEKIHPDWPIEQGVSAILSNTPKGKTTLEALSDSILNLKSEPFSNIYKGQSVVYIRPQRAIPKDRTLILEALRHAIPLSKVLHIIHSAKFGPIRIPRTSKVYKFLALARRVAGVIKRRLTQMVKMSPSK